MGENYKEALMSLLWDIMYPQNKRLQRKIEVSQIPMNRLYWKYNQVTRDINIQYMSSVKKLGDIRTFCLEAEFQQIKIRIYPIDNHTEML